MAHLAHQTLYNLGTLYCKPYYRFNGKTYKTKKGVANAVIKFGIVERRGIIRDYRIVGFNYFNDDAIGRIYYCVEFENGTFVDVMEMFVYQHQLL